MLRNLACVVLVGVLSVVANQPPAQADSKAPLARERVNHDGVLIIAHRGYSQVAPENTLPAFGAAVKAGADLVELDYLHSADGVPVVFHDKDLDRTTNARQLWGGEKIALTSKSLAELEQLDAGSWFRSEFKGTKLPRLDESIDAIQNGSMTLIERKHGDAATCAKLLRDKKLAENVVVQAFDWDFLADCHAQAPEIVLGALGHEECTPEKLDKAVKTGAKVVGWEHKYTTAETVRQIHERGCKAWVWTVDDPARALELVKAGVDGIITNRPAEIRLALEMSQAAK